DGAPVGGVLGVWPRDGDRARHQRARAGGDVALDVHPLQHGNADAPRPAAGRRPEPHIRAVQLVLGLRPQPAGNSNPADARAPISVPSRSPWMSGRSRSLLATQSRHAPSMNHSHAVTAVRTLGGAVSSGNRPSSTRPTVSARTPSIMSRISGEF